ncbi:MAG: hypothetical protein N2689_17210 [Verrucomicrobiae bacterium]|nr:hypothetical protein [Verrucomicrobiae bacterium]
MHKNLFITVVLSLMLQPLRAAEIRHRFIAKDESRCQVVYVDQTDPSKDWVLELGAKCRDTQLVGNNVLLVSSPDGYREYSLANRKMIKEVKGYPGAMSARRRPDGRTILACVQKEVTVYELSAQDQVRRKVVFKVPSTRIVRLTPQGTLLFGCKEQLFEGDLEGHVLRTFTLPPGSWVYQALRKPNGNLLVSGGYNPSLFELDPNGRILKTIGGKESAEAKTLDYHFFGAFQMLKNGDLVVCNWTGHGPRDGEKGAQILQFDPSGKVVWKWHDTVRAGSIHGVILMDDLDPAVLNDDVSSVLGPAK